MPDPIYIYPQQLFTVTINQTYRTDFTFPASTTAEARNYVLAMLEEPSQHHYLDELTTAHLKVEEKIVHIERTDDYARHT